MPSSTVAAGVRVLLASDRRRTAATAVQAPCVDRVQWGAVARRASPAAVTRAEPGPRGPLLLESRITGGEQLDEIWGPAGTPTADAQRALAQLQAWTGRDDRPTVLRDVVADFPLLRELDARLGPVRLGRVPRVGEALGRAVVHQLVQSTEAVRSVAQLVSRLGSPTARGLTTWPSAAVVGATPAWELRRCGIPLRNARSLHAAAVDDAALERAAAVGMDQLDRRLRALPGIGAWTSAETRLVLGDPDAVSVGDDHLHSDVTWALARVDPRESDDAHMLALLAPFAGQRGRVIVLIGRAYARGLLPRPPRRAPHAALSAHRYW